MKYISQYLIILAIGFAAELMNAVIPAPVPACIYGIIILFILLCSGILKLDHIKESARFLIDVHPVMFIPAGVGLIVIWSEVRDSVLFYLAVCVVSTVFTILVAGWVTQIVIKRKKKS